MSGSAADADFTRFGVAVGHATDDAGATGCTVVRGLDGPLRAAVAVLGRATGTRELALLEPGHLVDRVDALLLAGGSAYGLDAAAGVMRWCEERGRGFPVGPGVVPIVPAAVIFDLAPLGRFDARPTPEMGWAACETARPTGIAEGSVGAGTGATWGKARGAAHARKGGVGCAVVARGGLAAGAVMVVNAFGTVRDAVGRPMDGLSAAPQRDGPASFADAAGRNTTIGVVVVSLPLSKLALRALAQAATGAFHRRIVPAGSPFDGDVLFALAPMMGAGPGAVAGAGTGAEAGAGAPPEHHDTAAAGDMRHQARAGAIADAPAGFEPDPGTALALETLAAEAVEQAIERAVRRARGRDGIPGLADAAPTAAATDQPPA